MKKFNGREMKAFFILSIVVPVGLLTTFRLTGVLKGLVISETMTLTPIRWEFQRPTVNQYVPLAEELSFANTSDGMETTLQLIVWEYSDSVEWFPWGGNILVAMKINATTASPNGFVDGLSIVFSNDSAPSYFDFLASSVKLTNLSLVKVRSASNPTANVKAYAELDGVNHQSKVYFYSKGVWGLPDVSKGQAHQINVAYELTYYNGTAYRKIIQPFQLKVW